MKGKAMKIDLHVHTSEISLCGHVSAADTVKLYKEAGYGAIVVTNHFSADGIYHFAHQGRNDYFDAYYEGYELARKAGQECGLTVLNGYELRFRRNCNDYLVYGMPDEIARDYDAFILPTLSENYGYAIEEALLCGCPVIISRGTTPWDDIDGKGGAALELENPDAFVAELNKITEMDMVEYKEYTKNLNKYIYEKLSYEKLVDDYKTLIEKVAATKK